MPVSSVIRPVISNNITPVIGPFGNVSNVPFSPASLFAGGFQGGYWDVTNIASLFQSSDESSQVTASGQSIQRINDLSGNGFHFLQTTLANRPVYTESGSDKYAVCTNLVTSMQTTATISATPLPYYIATWTNKLSTANSLGFMAISRDAANHMVISSVGTGSRNSSLIRNTAKGASSILGTTNSATTGKFFYDFYAVPGTSSFRNKVGQSSGSNSWVAGDTLGGTAFLRLGGQTTTTTELQNWVGGLIIVGRTMSDTDRDNLQAWANARMGV